MFFFFFFIFFRSNGNILNADITMKEAVQFLTSDDENYQNCGASYIQHNTFISDKAKEEVLHVFWTVFSHVVYAIR